MSHSLGGIQVSVPSTVFPGRTGLIQVIPASSSAPGQSLIQHASPVARSETIIRANTLSSNTAVQYVRKPAITVLNPSSTFITQSVAQPYTTFGNTVMSINADVMQNLSNATGISSSGVNQMGMGGAASTQSSLATSRKPCNCTKSHCLKLYCECFAQGQLCQNCNCNNCMNNLGYEEERGRAIKMTLERNPTAFHPKIGRGEGERRHTKGCNCKRSGCLKNYCECYEAKISCSDLCRCQSCHNTEDSVERRSLLRLAAMGSLRSRQTSSFKKHLAKPHPETLPHVFFTWEVVEATAGCLLAQAEDAERRDLPPAAQERAVLEEFGRILEHVIDSASKAQVRSSTSIAADSEGEASVLHGGSGTPGYPIRQSDAVGAATAAAAAADVLLRDDDDDDDEMLREIGVMDENEPADEDIFDDLGGHRGSSRRHLPKHPRRVGRPRRIREPELDSDVDELDEPFRGKHKQIAKSKSRVTDIPYRPRRSTAASGRNNNNHDPDDMI